MRSKAAALAPLAGAVAVALAGCRGDDIAPPELRRPIEALPGGAIAVVVASDLRNTWQRVEAHEFRAVLERLPATASVLRDSTFLHAMALCREFETRTGMILQDDLVLNVLGDRAGAAAYPETDSTESTVLLVAELHDRVRFRAALDSLRAHPLPGSVAFHDEPIEGGTALRIDTGESDPLYIVQRDAFVAITPDLDRARQAIAIHAGQSDASVLRDPAVQAALQAVGQHGVSAVTRSPGDRWLAHGFTWDQKGLHFDHVASVTGAAPGVTPGADSKANAPAAIRASIPAGMTFAGWMRTSDLDLRGLGEVLRFGSTAPRVAIRPASTGAGLPAFLPESVREWAGEACGIALRGVEPTPLAPVPDVAFVIEVRDAPRAETDLRGLESRLALLPVGPLSGGFEDVQYGGRTYRALLQPVSERVSPCWFVDSDVAVVATTRTLLQQIIDTRRTGKRALGSDGAFERLRPFVPENASAAFYANQRRLHTVVQQLEGSRQLWGPKVQRGIEAIVNMGVVLDHFPAGAAYVTRTDSRVALRGWMLEGD